MLMSQFLTLLSIRLPVNNKTMAAFILIRLVWVLLFQGVTVGLFG